MKYRIRELIKGVMLTLLWPFLIMVAVCALMASIIYFVHGYLWESPRSVAVGDYMAAFALLCLVAPLPFYYNCWTGEKN